MIFSRDKDYDNQVYRVEGYKLCTLSLKCKWHDRREVFNALGKIPYKWSNFLLLS